MRLLPRGLRARSATAFALLALVLSLVLSVATYQLARTYLLDQRERLATRQVMVDALIAEGLVAASDGRPDSIQASLGSISNARAVLRVAENWYSAVVELSEESVPDSLLRAVDDDGPARQRVRVNGVPYLLVGAALPSVDGAYFEFVPLTEYERTLATIAVLLTIGASVTTITGALAGWLISRRVLRPLGSVAAAARAMSAGDLSRRLDAHDPDLAPVVESFNDMAESLEQRIERELRFTADVSHELRTPLTAMASAIGLAHRAALTGRAKFAVDVLDAQVDHLRRLTLELLEISRIDAGVSELQPERVDVEELVARVMAGAEVPRERLHSSLGDQPKHALDRTRFERVCANLLENAERYGGGATDVWLERDGAGSLTLMVDDAGPGVGTDERVAIFGRFHRGSAEQPADKPKGTGLGLALVDEHVRLHGGTAWVTDSPAGGARFVVTIPERP